MLLAKNAILCKKKANLRPEFLVVQGQFVGHVVQFLLGRLGQSGAVAPQGRKGHEDLGPVRPRHGGMPPAELIPLVAGAIKFQ